MRGKKQRHDSDATPKELLVLSSPRVATRHTTEKRQRRTTEQQVLFNDVCVEWARSRGWPDGKWPKKRSYDALLIGRMVVKLGAPLDFWKRAIAAVPLGFEFSWLVKGPQAGQIGRAEQWWLNEMERRRNAARPREEVVRGASGMRALGDILREAQQRG
jgi:hypothetical protein